jgi:hypothetical protein
MPRGSLHPAEAVTDTTKVHSLCAGSLHQAVPPLTVPPRQHAINLFS